ncbi:hypothetical protein AGMMS49579_27040 [Spirochaetia bacterium]|nr:hypothetical protein AGMMS49579_27040 [Spirochaetia bacterium]
MQAYILAKSQAINQFLLNVTNYYKGDRYDDTCLAELNLFDENIG